MHPQLMERAKVSGSLELPPELLEVMQHLQEGTASLPVSGLMSSSSMGRVSASGRFSHAGRFSNAGRYSLNSRVSDVRCLPVHLVDLWCQGSSCKCVVSAPVKKP